MPAVRLSRRRRSSLAISFNPAKAGYYGVHSPSPRPVTFAPNVTPGTYVEPDFPSASSSEPPSPTSKLFPPSECVPPAPSRRRVPPGKRRSMGYIPRPPNAFMLFRADFVRQKHVPGSIETNHGSLSKIIGNCWRSLPLEEKRVWEVKAKHAKAEHKARYPEYRFRPVHNKNKDKKKDKSVPTAEDERRCETVAQLLLEGKKGDELAAAVRYLDRARADNPPPAYPHRRSSSVPLPNNYPITLPTIPFLSLSRPTSPVSNISRSTRIMMGQRRASSARPAGSVRSWTMPTPSSLPRDDSPLPEVDASLFEQFSFPSVQDGTPFNFHDVLSSLPPHLNSPHELSLGPLDPIGPHDLSYSPQTGLPEFDPLTWLPSDLSQSHSSSAYSGSPAQSDYSLPVVAPQPQHANPTSPTFADHNMWNTNVNENVDTLQEGNGHVPHTELVYSFEHDNGMGFGFGWDFPQSHSDLQSLFEPSFCGSGGNIHSTTTADFHPLNFGYEYNDMAHE